MADSLNPPHRLDRFSAVFIQSSHPHELTGLVYGQFGMEHRQSQKAKANRRQGAAKARKKLEEVRKNA